MRAATGPGQRILRRPGPVAAGNQAGPRRGASGRTGASMGRAPAPCRTCGTCEPSGHGCATDPDPAAWIGPRRDAGCFTDRLRRLLIVRPPAALPPSYDLTGTACVARAQRFDEPVRGHGRVSRARGWPRGRRVMLNGAVADTPISVWCSPGLTPLAERPRCSRKRSGHQQSGYNASEGEKSSAVRGAPVDFRGHIRVRRLHLHDVISFLAGQEQFSAIRKRQRG